MSEKLDDLLQAARRAFTSDAEHATWAADISALVARERADAAEAMREAAAIKAQKVLDEDYGAVDGYEDVVDAIRALPLPDADPQASNPAAAFILDESFGGPPATRAVPDKHRLQAQRVPEGWKLVPLVPTEAMRRAAFGPIMEGGRFGPVTGDYIRQQAAIGVFQKMLAAAPAPPIPDDAPQAQPDLTSQYKPTVIDLEDGGVSEFTLFDCATVGHWTGDYETLVDFDGHIVGFRWSNKHPPTKPATPQAQRVSEVWRSWRPLPAPPSEGGKE